MGVLEGYSSTITKMTLELLLVELNQLKYDAERTDDLDEIRLKLIQFLVTYIGNKKVEAAVDDIAF